MSEPAAPSAESKPTSPPVKTNLGDAIQRARDAAKGLAAAPKTETAKPEPAKPAPPAEPSGNAGQLPASAAPEIKLPDDVLRKMTAMETELRGFRKAKETPAADPLAELKALYSKDPKKAIATLAGKPDAEEEILTTLSDYYLKLGEGPDVSKELTEVKETVADVKKRLDEASAEREAARAAEELSSRDKFVGGLLDHNKTKYPIASKASNRAEAIEAAVVAASMIASNKGLDEKAVAELPETDVAALLDEAFAEVEAEYAALAARLAPDLPQTAEKATVTTGSNGTPTRETPRIQAPSLHRPAVTTASPTSKRLTVQEATAKAREAAAKLVARQ